MKTINELLEAVSASANDELLIHLSTGADRKIKYANLIPNASHNSIFRGKNLGTITSDNIDTFIAEHQISTGVFKDLYVGDYFTASYGGSSKVFRIAGFDCYYNTGDTALTKHHLVIVPDSYLEQAKMNSTHTTNVSENPDNPSEEAAFAGSDMFNITLKEVDNKLTTIFGGHLLSHREYLSNKIDTNAVSAGFSSYKGASNGWAWYDVKSCLLSEIEVYGSKVWSSSPYDTGISCRQLPLFSLEPQYINNGRLYYWLKDVVSSTIFADVNGNGYANYDCAGGDLSVRPRFLIG